MNTFIKAVLFSISTAIIAAPAMAATQHHDKVQHVEKKKAQPPKHIEHKQPPKHETKKDVKKHPTPIHKTEKHDTKHR